MLFTTLPQFAVLGLLAFGALVLGLGLHPGSKKWRARLDDESDEFAAYRREADIQLRDANRRIGVLERDHAALQERTALAEQKAATAQDTIVAPVVTAAPLAGPLPVAPPHPKPPEPPEPVAPREPLVDRPMPIAANAAVPAFPTPMTHRTAPPTPPAVEAIPEPVPTESRKTGFGTGTDDLTRIRGLDGTLKAKLQSLGVTSFGDIETLSAEDEMALEQRLNVPVGYLAREQWREQAALLRAGHGDAHRERFWTA